MPRAHQRPSGLVPISCCPVPFLKNLYFKSPAEISATAQTSQGAALADIHGGVHILDSKFEPSTSWQAHPDGRVTHLTERKGILVTLGVCTLLITRLLIDQSMHILPFSGREILKTPAAQDMGPGAQGQSYEGTGLTTVGESATWPSTRSSSSRWWACLNVI
jgi:hypothetical protein